MRVIGTRFIKEKEWFGKVEKDASKPIYQFKELEAIVHAWIKGEAK